jgi:uncharacterized membrane protein
MGSKERIFHAVLFELIALVALTLLAVATTDQEAGSMTLLAMILSLIAMAWNYVFNLGFDRVHPGDRLKRSLKVRITHGALFELGMVVFSFPVIMLILQKSFLTVLALDIGVVLFFFVYAIGFNWAYDVVRDRVLGDKPEPECAS